MNLKDQWQTIKKNWLIAGIILVLLALVLVNSGGFTSQKVARGYYAVPEMAAAPSIYREGVYYNDNFAPEIEDRKITKIVRISSEIENGKFKQAETNLKSILSVTDSFLLNEDVRRHGEGIGAYYQGYYQIKVEKSEVNEKYDINYFSLKIKKNK